LNRVAERLGLFEREGAKRAHDPESSTIATWQKPRVEVFRRNEDGGSWTLYIAEASESAKIAPTGCELAVDEVYASALTADL